MSKIKNGGLDQYATEHFEQQQFGTAGVEGAKSRDRDETFQFRDRDVIETFKFSNYRGNNQLRRLVRIIPQRMNTSI